MFNSLHLSSPRNIYFAFLKLILFYLFIKLSKYIVGQPRLPTKFDYSGILVFCRTY